MGFNWLTLLFAVAVLSGWVGFNIVGFLLLHWLMGDF